MRSKTVLAFKATPVPAGSEVYLGRNRNAEALSKPSRGHTPRCVSHCARDLCRHSRRHDGDSTVRVKYSSSNNKSRSVIYSVETTVPFLPQTDNFCMRTFVLTSFIFVLVVSIILASPSIARDDSATVRTLLSAPLLGEECGGFVYEVQCAEDLKCCPVPYWSDYLTCQAECVELKAEA